MILRAFALTLGQIGDPRFLRVLVLGILLALVLLVAFSAGFVWLTGWLVGDHVWLPFLGEVRWVSDLASWGMALLLTVLSVFLMVPVASAITSMFLDDVADAVEAKHYPHMPSGARLSWADSLRDTVQFLGVMVLVNAVALIFYVLFSPLALFIFWGVNGLLLGREYFTLAAARRVGRDGARTLRRKHFGTIWLAGVLMAMPLSVPLLGLVIPILGAATFTHLFHILAGQKAVRPTVPDHPR